MVLGLIISTNFRLLLDYGKRMCESIKCTPYCGLLKVMGREVPIGDLIIVSQWEIIH
jgi:hypothetical protein